MTDDPSGEQPTTGTTDPIVADAAPPAGGVAAAAPEHTPHLGSSEPGYVPPPALHVDSSTQDRVDRLYSLLGTIDANLPSNTLWATREARAILADLGATPSE